TVPRIAQPLTETLNQLARGWRRACDMIEELGRREDFYLHLAGGSCRRTAGAVFHNSHLPYKLSCANRAEKDAIAIEFPEYVDGTADESKNTVCRVPLSEEDLPCGEVRASHCGSQSPIRGQISLPASASVDASAHTGNIGRDLPPSQSEMPILSVVFSGGGDGGGRSPELLTAQFYTRFF